MQGRKHVILGETEYVCDSSSFLLSSIDVPAQSQIIEASAKAPLLVMFLRFDMPMVREMLSQEDLPEVGRLRAIGTSGDLVQRTARAISWLRANFTKPLYIEELANTARMGVSTLHPSISCVDLHEPIAISDDAQASDRARTHVDGRLGCDDCRLRGSIRKH